MSRTLYHYPLSPFCRKIRVVLTEKNLPFEMVVENFWERRREFLIMNPAAQVPVLKEEKEEIILSDSVTICEYLEERYMKNSLLDKKIKERAEIRRISSWYNNKFYYEVTKHLLDEKLYKCLRGQGEPNSEAIRAAKKNIHYHLDYIGHLRKTRQWLAGDKFSLADITAAAQLSVVDYFNDVPWERNGYAREWYALVKSRPSFRPILKDRIPGFKPPAHYEDPDF